MQNVSQGLKSNEMVRVFFSKVNIEQTDQPYEKTPLCSPKSRSFITLKKCHFSLTQHELLAVSL